MTTPVELVARGGDKLGGLGRLDRGTSAGGAVSLTRRAGIFFGLGLIASRPGPRPIGRFDRERLRAAVASSASRRSRSLRRAARTRASSSCIAHVEAASACNNKQPSARSSARPLTRPSLRPPASPPARPPASPPVRRTARPPARPPARPHVYTYVRSLYILARA